MDENGNLDKQTVETWKEKNVLIDRSGDDALVMRRMADGRREYVVAHGYDEETGHWGYGTYYDSLASAAADLEGRAISPAGEEVIFPDFWCRSDIEAALEHAGLPVSDANVDAALEALGLDGDWLGSDFHDRLVEQGNEMIADAVGEIGADDGGRDLAVAVGYCFGIVGAREASGIGLKESGTVVTVDGRDYKLMKGATYEDSLRVDDLLDSHREMRVSDYRKAPKEAGDGVTLRGEAASSRQAADRLADVVGERESPVHDGEIR